MAQCSEIPAQGGVVAKRVVITIHGIRTRGAWQKDLATVLSKNDMVPYPLDYGRLGVLGFLTPCVRASKLDWFHREYDRIRKQENVKRPSIIAHSFGTYLVAELLSNYPEVKFDKVIFAGGLAPKDFDWKTKFHNGQVLHVLNEVAKKDIWPAVAKRVIPRAGCSGSSGFCSQIPDVEQNFSPIGHSGTFFEGRYDEWARCINMPLLAPSDAKDIRDILSIATQQVASFLNVPLTQIRANLFVPIGDVLIIPQGASVNMDGHPDESIRITKGRGATGHVFKNLKFRDPYIVMFNGGWGSNTLPAGELRKVHPDLKWIMSFPLTDPEDGQLFGVMNLDGLYNGLDYNLINGATGQKLLSDLELSADILADKLCTLEHGRM